ncbi:hypothetical protein KCW65_23500, partial [Mycobacterium tuberculosis]|nr:hypothetical protein [Mycobacterium tuberculosis]
PGKDAKFDALRDLLDPAIDGHASGASIEVHWWFTAVPEAITGTDGAVSGIDIDVAGEAVHLEVDSVITAIGFVRDTATVARQGICPVSPIPGDGRISDG